MPLNLRELFGKDHVLRDVEFWPGAVLEEEENRVHKSVTVIGPIKGETLFLTIIARDSFDEGLCKSLFTFVDAHASELSWDREVTIIEAFHHEGYPFDSVLVLSGLCDKRYAPISEELHRRTIEAFPIVRYEFGRNHTFAEVDDIRRDGPCIIDWKRTPCPFVLIRHRNQMDQTYSSGKRLWYSTESRAIYRLSALTDDKSSFVELENFLGQHVRMVAQGGRFAVESGDEQISVETLELTRWVHEFLTRGLATPSP